MGRPNIFIGGSRAACPVIVIAIATRVTQRSVTGGCRARGTLTVTCLRQVGRLGQLAHELGDDGADGAGTRGQDRRADL